MEKTFAGKFVVDDTGFTLCYKNVDYLKTREILFCPDFKEAKISKPDRIEKKRSKISYFFGNKEPISKLSVFLTKKKDHFEIHSEAFLNRDLTLTEWNVFGKNATITGFDQIVVANPNIKGRLTTGVFDKIRLNDQFPEISYTMGISIPSWFFPLPVNYICATYREMLFLGLDNVYDFSQWSVSIKNSLIKNWSLEYGNHLKFKKGQKIRSPKWIGFFMDSDDPFEPWPAYTEILKQKNVFRNNHKERPLWWTDLNYVTWGDQHVYANGKKTETYRQTETNLSVETVRRWLSIIEKYDLPFKTITIDGYWCRQIGEWEADETRFCDMRSFVDELHTRGYKVLFWYCPFEAEKTSPVYKKHPEYFVKEIRQQELFLEKDIKVETRPRYDYTNPEVRKFIREDIRRILSPEKKCYNGDGLKLDFYGSAPNAKIIKRFHNPSWGIGHKFILKSHALLYKWAKLYKPDCRIDGENGNPFFADYTDSLRAWDWCESDYTPYNDRVKLASVICPGVPALYDEHIHFKNLYRYCIRSAVARPIFFNVEHFHGDMHKLTPKEYKHLSLILQTVQKLNRLARDIRPEDMDKGKIHDRKGKLIGRILQNDTVLVAKTGKCFEIIIANDSDKERFVAAGVEPGEFGIKGKPFTVSATVAAGKVLKIRSGAIYRTS